MSKTHKILAVLVGAALILVFSTGIMVAGTAVTNSLMTVSIHEGGPDGLDLFVPVPVGLVEAVLAIAPPMLRLVDEHHHIDAELGHIRAELDEVLPAIDAVLDGVSEMPDAVLVEIDGSNEYVRVSKEGRSINVLVMDGNDRISISVPTRVVRSLSRFLEG